MGNTLNACGNRDGSVAGTADISNRLKGAFGLGNNDADDARDELKGTHMGSSRFGRNASTKKARRMSGGMSSFLGMNGGSSVMRAPRKALGAKEKKAAKKAAEKEVKKPFLNRKKVALSA